MKLRNIFISFCLIFGLLCPVSAKSLSSEKIVFSSNRDGNWEIYIMNPDGTRQERLTYDRAVDWEPVISPAGDRILFNSQTMEAIIRVTGSRRGNYRFRQQHS